MTCPRCGLEVFEPVDRARLGADVADATTRLAKAFAEIRLAIPQRLVQAKHDLERLAPELARQLACVAGVCRPPGGGGGELAARWQQDPEKREPREPRETGAFWPSARKQRKQRASTARAGVGETGVGRVTTDRLRIAYRTTRNQRCATGGSQPRAPESTTNRGLEGR